MPGAFLNWLADLGHFVIGLLYWNTRKTIYVFKGRRGRSPCQNPSDEQMPGRMRCDAVLQWHEPERFRKLCPLLIKTPDGWCCAAAATQVKPFWGRAIAWSGGIALACYLIAATSVWIGMRVGGRVPVSWTTVAWPGWWVDIPAVQATHLLDEAMMAFRQGRLQQAQLALTTARVRDPGNYEVALLLAQISMFERSYLFADEQFMQLSREHPAQQLRTAITFHDTLLALDRMDKLAEFSAAMAVADRSRAAVWIRSMLLAVRSMSVAEAANFRKQQDGLIPQLAPHAQLLLMAEIKLCEGRKAEAIDMLRRSFSGLFNPFYTQYQMERLAELGAAADARMLLDARGPLLGDFDRALSQVTVGLAANDRMLALGAFRTLMRMPLNNQRIERVAGLLVRYSDSGFYQQLHARLESDPAFVPTVDAAGMWITGLVCGRPEEAGYWQRHGQKLPFATYPAIQLDFTSRDLLKPNSVVHLVNIVTFPREVILALLWRAQPRGNPARER